MSSVSVQGQPQVDRQEMPLGIKIPDCRPSRKDDISCRGVPVGSFLSVGRQEYISWRFLALSWWFFAVGIFLLCGSAGICAYERFGVGSRESRNEMWLHTFIVQRVEEGHRAHCNGILSIVNRWRVDRGFRLVPRKRKYNENSILIDE
jgi:hypothetical protein